MISPWRGSGVDGCSSPGAGVRLRAGDGEEEEASGWRRRGNQGVSGAFRFQSQFFRLVTHTHASAHTKSSKTTVCVQFSLCRHSVDTTFFCTFLKKKKKKKKNSPDNTHTHTLSCLKIRLVAAFHFISLQRHWEVR